MNEVKTMCYIGVKECGCVVAACVDNPKHKKDIAKNVGDWVKDGLTIERISVEDTRNRLSYCKCNEEIKANELDLFQTNNNIQ